MIRIARESDVPQMLAIYGPYVENTTYSFEYATPSETEFLERFREYTQQFPWLVYEQGDVILGYAYASAPFSREAFRWCCEPSIYLAPQAHRRGIGKRLYQALEQILRLQGYRLSYAIITSDNEPSIAFHEALGYRRLAIFPGCGYKHGHWTGVIWMEKELDFVENPSVFPAKWREIVNNDRKMADILDKMSLS